MPDAKGRPIVPRRLPADRRVVESLTPRETEVLFLIADGATNKEIGRRLGISSRTVEVHRARIMSKLLARNLGDLVRIYYCGSDAVA